MERVYQLNKSGTTYKTIQKGIFHQEHEDNQNERSNTKNEEHLKSDDEIYESNASEAKEDSEIEGVVYLKGELISTLDELKEEINKNNALMEQMQKYQ